MRTDEQRAKHAEYMRGYYAAHPGYKSQQDAKHRQKYRDKLSEYDRKRNMTPERIAQRAAQQKLRHQLKGDEIRAYGKRYYQENRERLLGQQKAYKLAMPVELRRFRNSSYSLRHRHGLTPEQYDEILIAQGGKCALCETRQGEKGFNGRLHVDHDHITGKIRGLLCMYCNHALERVENHNGWANRAHEYLERYK
jgi:hypothetical protein